MKLTEEEWKKAIEERLTPEIWGASLREMVEFSLTALPDRMQETAQEPDSDLHHILRACAAMTLKANMACTRGIMDHLCENYQEKPEVLLNQVKVLMERFKNGTPPK